ncbi:ferrous iron transport protein A [Clostridium collagenovorans DSM 3089]|uniref:Ferrous iron transport protein A n=1 Tax=Clostridium collagenovorans DSM 3089 TaxID=1121306 RepID=A0A1M5X3W8_9CLOT|nr:FeoA family protein [Clostridium collagenovorans]SHH94481.1 ferrous iron transport protein A [Clostridium collagenovorans DSM 3089]
MNSLEKLEVGNKVVVKNLDKDSAVRRRLLDMGITPGVTVEIIGKAPMGDPIEIMVRGYKLTLRKKEAQGILI